MKPLTDREFLLRFSAEQIADALIAEPDLVGTMLGLVRESLPVTAWGSRLVAAGDVLGAQGWSWREREEPHLAALNLMREAAAWVSSQRLPESLRAVVLPVQRVRRRHFEHGLEVASEAFTGVVIQFCGGQYNFIFNSEQEES